MPIALSPPTTHGGGASYKNIAKAASTPEVGGGPLEAALWRWSCGGGPVEAALWR